MAVTRTFSIIKPDATRRNLTGAITKMLEDAGSSRHRLQAYPNDAPARPRAFMPSTRSGRFSTISAPS